MWQWPVGDFGRLEHFSGSSQDNALRECRSEKTLQTLQTFRRWVLECKLAGMTLNFATYLVCRVKSGYTFRASHVEGLGHRAQKSHGW
jgi:hypothetical protein